MFIFTILTTITNYFLNYTKGFTTTEIPERRTDAIQTTLFTILIVTGFKPVFKLIKNIIIFIKETILGLFFPNKKLQNLEIKNAKQEYREQQLIKKLDEIRDSQNKLQSQISTQKLKVALWRDKKERKRLLKSQKHNNTSIGKDNEND
ncbi:hypothetical protein [Rice orange leaf phytoplasma]|uniref:hypothetical protein n=1 Tax=Rice orange leaf phytoplasma TaxID=146897 RepID=UPI0008F5F674|nr:hypothetical protein [Rice orange leaf phytoplasma]OIJ44635.1 hypothetical protein BHE82_02950 [Rice orange leaf phytoplasma]